jgi:hypothetical protein
MSANQRPLSGDEGIKFSYCEEYVTTLAVNEHDRKRSYIQVKAIIVHLGGGWWQKKHPTPNEQTS